MGFDDADDDVFAALVAANGFAEHVVGFAYTGGVAEEELEGAAGFFRGDCFEPLFGALECGHGWVAGSHRDKICECDDRLREVQSAMQCRLVLSLSL